MGLTETPENDPYVDRALVPVRCHSVACMDFEDVLSVLLGWMGQEVEVGTHGANGDEPVTALETRGILRRGDDFEKNAVSRGSLAFYLADTAGTQIAAFRLYKSAYSGGGWFDDKEEVLEIRSGVIQLLIATTLSRPRPSPVGAVARSPGLSAHPDPPGDLAGGGPDRSVRPILVAGFGCFSFHRMNPASILVEEMEEALPTGRFAFQPWVPVDVESPDRIARRAEHEDARAIVVFGLSERPFPAVLRLEQFSRRKVAPSLGIGRRKGVRRRLAEEDDERLKINEEFLSAVDGIDGVSLGTRRSAGSDICNWTLYRLARHRPPAALLHIPWLRPCEARPEVAEKLLRAIDARFP
jgi:hypothetical protein